MKQKHNLLTILMIALTSTLLIFTACEDEEEDDPITEEPTNSAPTCSITSPENEAVFPQGETITIAVDAVDEDENIQEVKFYVNAIEINSDNSFPYSFDWDTSAEEPGSFTIKAEAIDEVEEKTSDEISLTIVSGFSGGTLTDIDGNVYSTVQIGDQEWMAENLKTTTYNEGTTIDLVTNHTAWKNYTTGAYCWYDNDQAAYANIYGALYNWYAVNTSDLCPDGWHVPTDEEWTELTDYLGGAEIAGGKMKAAGTTYWSSPNEGATNLSGFSALPGGTRNYDLNFSGLNTSAHFWSSTEAGFDLVWYRGLYYDDVDVNRFDYQKDQGFSVRCVSD